MYYRIWRCPYHLFEYLFSACIFCVYIISGGGKSKKLAKRQAAFSMLQKLTDLPQEQHPNEGLHEDEEDVSSQPKTWAITCPVSQMATVG